MLIRDRRVAVSYMIEALRIFDHYHFRLSVLEGEEDSNAITLKRPPRKASDEPWWKRFYTDPHKVKDRKLFA